MLTDRDLQICLHLFEHRVLTTEQISELHFSALRRARRRLLRLTQLGVLERFRPRRETGSHPLHYILGEVGLAVVAAYRGVEEKELGIRQDRLRGLAYSPRLPHLVQVNGFFSRLGYECRRRAESRLTEWWGEARCAANWGGFVRPDGLGAVSAQKRTLRFFLEVDRGTENSSRLERKLVGYRRVAGFPDAPDVLLFVFHSGRREAEARKVLSDPGMPVATTTEVMATDDPLGPIWLRLRGERRVTLLDLALAGEAA
jgi:hypothetical protein